MKKIIYIFIIIHLSLSISYSQVTQEWVQRYNGPGNGEDEAVSIAVDGSGNVYITGFSEGIPLICDYVTIKYDYATLKYNSGGVMQWVQRYRGPGNDFDVANCLIVDKSENVYVTGYSEGNGTGYDYATIKYNTNGIQLWVQRYNGPGNGNDVANCIAVDDSGNVYVTGYSIGIGSGYDYTTIKYNTDGVQQWVQIYNGPGNYTDAATSISVDGSGNVYVTGYSAGVGANYGYATIKYNASGVQQWVQRYNGPGNDDDRAFSIVVDASGNVYVTGESYGNGTTTDYATIKYNMNGVQQWVQRYNGTGNSYDRAHSLAVDIDGYVYVTGESKGIETDYDFATIKYSASGVEQWVQRYNGPGNLADIANSLAVDSMGNVYVTGTSYGNNMSKWDYATIKYSPSGVQSWLQRYNGPGNYYDGAKSIAIDFIGNVYVTGFSTGSGTSNQGYDYATIKYSQNIGIKPISSEIPDRYTLYQNYPNPFNPSTKIKFEIPAILSPLRERGVGGFIAMKIYDILGREVATLINEQLRPGTYEVEWDGTNYPSGVYFYELISGDFSLTKKLILLK